MEFSKGELKLIAALAISPGRELNRDAAARLFDRPSEFERTTAGLRKFGICSVAPVTGAVGLSVQQAARFLDLEGPVQEQPALNWNDDELNRTIRDMERLEGTQLASVRQEGAAAEHTGAPAGVFSGVVVRAGPGVAREHSARVVCGDSAHADKCECGNPQFYGADVPAGLRETLVAMGVCDRHARERGLVRTVRSTFRTFSEKERTNVIEAPRGAKQAEAWAAVERTLQEPKWARRLREEPEVMRRALQSARGQIEGGFVPKKSTNGWLYLHHYTAAGGRLD